MHHWQNLKAWFSILRNSPFQQSHKTLLVLLVFSLIIHLLIIMGIKSSTPTTPATFKKSSILTISLPSHQTAFHTAINMQSQSVLQPSSNTFTSSSLADTKTNNSPLPTKALPAQIDTERYYNAWELDKIPSPQQDIKVEYPTSAKEIGVVGTVKLELLIGEDGEVDAVNIISMTVPEIFNRPAIDAFSDQVFTAGQINSKPVKSRMIMSIHFEENPSPSTHLH